MPGPVPRRSTERRRTNSPPVETTPALPGTGSWVPPAEAWHPIAVDWYASLALSGQSAYYQDSDRALARYVAEAMSRNLEAGRFSAQLFASVMAASGELLSSEASRRRVRIEVERETVDRDRIAAVTTMKDWQSKLGTGAGV